MFRVILFISTLFLSVFVFSQKKTDSNILEKSNAILKAEMQKNIDALALLQTSSDTQSSAKFIATAYKNIGLQPFTYSDYIQPFTLDLGKEIKPATTLKINGVVLEVISDFWPFAFCPNASFAGTAVWDGMQTNQPYLYDLKPIIEKNKTITKEDLIQHIKEKVSELANKNITALLVYNSADINDELDFSTTDTTRLAPIPIIYFTKAGIKKLKNESTIAIAIDAHVVLGEKKINGKNAIAALNNDAANTVVIAAPNNNLTSIATMLQLAKLLKETCHPAKKNSTGLIATDYANNNYLFASFDDIESNHFGSYYFLNNLPFSIEKINYAININIIGGSNDTINFLKIDGINSSQFWSSIFEKFDVAFNSKISSGVMFNQSSTNIYANKTPVLHLYNSASEPTLKRKLIINTTDIKTIDYITQLIGAANNKGKLPFNNSNK